MASGFDLLAPAGYGSAVSLSDSADLPVEARSLFIGVGGNITMDVYDPVTLKRTPVLFKNVPAGTVLPIRTPKIYSTGTAATDIVALN